MPVGWVASKIRSYLRLNIYTRASNWSNWKTGCTQSFELGLFPCSPTQCPFWKASMRSHLCSPHLSIWRDDDVAWWSGKWCTSPIVHRDAPWACCDRGTVTKEWESEHSSCIILIYFWKLWKELFSKGWKQPHHHWRKRLSHQCSSALNMLQNSCRPRYSSTLFSMRLLRIFGMSSS